MVFEITVGLCHALWTVGSARGGASSRSPCWWGDPCLGIRSLAPAWLSPSSGAWPPPFWASSFSLENKEAGLDQCSFQVFLGPPKKPAIENRGTWRTERTGDKAEWGGRGPAPAARPPLPPAPQGSRSPWLWGAQLAPCITQLETQTQPRVFDFKLPAGHSAGAKGPVLCLGSLLST